MHQSGKRVEKEIVEVKIFIMKSKDEGNCGLRIYTYVCQDVGIRNVYRYLRADGIDFDMKSQWS